MQTNLPNVQHSVMRASVNEPSTSVSINFHDQKLTVSFGNPSDVCSLLHSQGLLHGPPLYLSWAPNPILGPCGSPCPGIDAYLVLPQPSGFRTKFFRKKRRGGGAEEQTYLSSLLPTGMNSVFGVSQNKPNQFILKHLRLVIMSCLVPSVIP